MSPPPNSVSHFGALHWPSTCVRSAVTNPCQTRRVLGKNPNVLWSKLLEPLVYCCVTLPVWFVYGCQVGKTRTNSSPNRKAEHLEFITFVCTIGLLLLLLLFPSKSDTVSPLFTVAPVTTNGIGTSEV